MLLWIIFYDAGGGTREISYDKFLGLVEEKKVEKVELASNRIYITLTDKAREEKEEEEEKENDGGIGSITSIFGQFQFQTGGDGEKDPDYYTGYVSDDRLAQILDEANIEFPARCRIRQVL